MMGNVYKLVKFPEAESLMDDWEKAVTANRNGWAKLFKTQGYLDRCCQIEYVQREIDIFMAKHFPACEWKIQRENINHKWGWVINAQPPEDKT